MGKRARFLTSRSADGWTVRREGTLNASSVHRTASSAWDEARRLARGAGGEARFKSDDGSPDISNRYDVGTSTKSGSRR